MIVTLLCVMCIPVCASSPICFKMVNVVFQAYLHNYNCERAVCSCACASSVTDPAEPLPLLNNGMCECECVRALVSAVCVFVVFEVRVYMRVLNLVHACVRACV